jgi:hypothetical protein
LPTNHFADDRDQVADAAAWFATRAGQTKTLPPVLKSVTSLLRNHQDKQMLMFKKSNPGFYASYVSARVIVDRGGHKGAQPQPPARRLQHRSNIFLPVSSAGMEIVPADFFISKYFIPPVAFLTRRFIVHAK